MTYPPRIPSSGSWLSCRIVEFARVLPIVPLAGVASLIVLGWAALASASPAPDRLDARARIAATALRSGQNAQELASRGFAIDASGALDVFVRGPVTRAALEAAGARVRTSVTGICTASIPIAALDRVQALRGVEGIHGAVPLEPELDVSVPATGVSVLRTSGPGFFGLAGRGVLVGAVDSGIDESHGDFEDVHGKTRLVAIWDQVSQGRAPAAYGYGAEWLPEDIDGGVCEQTDRTGHGTHVMGIAAGDGSQSGYPFTYTGMAPMADLVMIKHDGSATGLIDGIQYIFDLATRRNENAVVNLSLGTQYGPHDGTSDVEAMIDQLAGPGRIVVKSAGNDRGSGLHANLKTELGETSARIFLSDFDQNPGDRLGIAAYYDAADSIDLQITTPNGVVLPIVHLGQEIARFPGIATPTGYIYATNGLPLTETGPRQVYLEINNDFTHQPGGRWTLTFLPRFFGPRHGEVDLWVFYAAGYSLAQVLADDQDDTKLISEPGNSEQVITAAAYVTKREWIDCNGTRVWFIDTAVGDLAPFSSPGPTRDGRSKPDIAAPGSAIASTLSSDILKLCPSPPRTSTIVYNDDVNHVMDYGSSMAAPHVSGAVALLLERFGPLTPAEVKRYLFDHATHDPETGLGWNADWGYGKLHIDDLIPPQATVSAPAAGAVLRVNQATTIQWNATDAVGTVDRVDIKLSRHGLAGPFEYLARGIPNSGTFDWTVTGPATDSLEARIGITAWDVAGNDGSSPSVAFTIDRETATELAGFEAEYRNGSIALRWRFSGLAAHSMVALERAEAIAGPWLPIGIAREVDPDWMTTTDAAVMPGTLYRYRLVVTRPGGGPEIFGPIDVEAAATTVDGLRAIGPNPSAGPVAITFGLARPERCRVSVVDLQGREVALVTDGNRAAGLHRVMWDGMASGRRAPAGLYVLRLSAGAIVQSRKLALVP